MFFSPCPRLYCHLQTILLTLVFLVFGCLEAADINYAQNANLVVRPLKAWDSKLTDRAVDGDRKTPFFTYSPCEWEVWFPRAKPVPITSVRVYLGPETWAPRNISYKGEIQFWNGTEWKILQEFKQSGNWDAPIIWQGQEVLAAGLRLVVTDSDWRIGGGGGGGDVGVYEIEAFGPDANRSLLNVSEAIKIKPLGEKHPHKFANGKIFPLGAESKFEVDLADREKLPEGKYTITAQIRDWQLNPLIVLPGQPLDTRSGSSLAFSWTAKEQGPYLLDIFVVKDGAVIGFKRELFGVRDDRMFSKGEIKSLSGPPGLKQKTMGELTGNRILFGVGDFAEENFPTNPGFARVAKEAGFDCVKAWQSWRSLEPLPGVYSFKRIDDLFKNATDVGLGVGICFFSMDPPEWLSDEYSLYQDGTRNAFQPMQYGKTAPSNYGENNRLHRAMLASLLAKRYGAHPLLVNWMPNPVDIEGGINESPESRRDYSRWAAAEFQAFLRDYKGWTLEQLNDRWGTTLGAWGDVQPPRPAFELTGNLVNGFAIDVRPMWLDWMEYKEWSHTNALRSVIEPLRAASPETPMNLWSDLGWGEGYFLPYLGEKKCAVAYCAMGHGDGLQIPKQAMFSRRFGVPYRDEYHLLCPSAPAYWDGGIYDILAMEAKYYDWIGMVPSSAKNVFSIAPSFFLAGRVKEVLNELSEARRPPGQIGYLWSLLASQIQGKGGAWYVDSETYSRAMAVGDYTKLKHRWIEPFVFGGPLEDLNGCKVVFADNVQVIPEGDAAKVAGYVESGGKLVLPWTAGRYLRPPLGEKAPSEIPGAQTKWLGVNYRVLKPTYPLLSALGYRQPEKLSEPERRGMLSVVEDHPALKNLAGAGVQFVVPLDPSSAPGSRVIATVNGHPAALAWPLGKGEVVLLGFVLGDIPMEEFYDAQVGRFSSEKAKAVTQAANAGTKQMTESVCQLLENLEQWVDVKADLEGPDTVRGHYGRRGDGHYAMLFNFTGEKWDKDLAKTNTVWKFPSLPEGAYEVSLIRIRGEESLGEMTADALRTKGVTLDFKPQEFIAIRCVRKN